jgi:NADPH-dependent 2,4-dienoyl-CoA reductase/sulfur reductase-like enzyme
VDRNKCTGLGICEAMAPEVFEVDESGELVLLTGADLLLGTTADALDPQRRTVHVGSREIGYLAPVIATGATTRTLPGADRIYAAGDVACWQNPLFDQPMRIEHWTSAAEQDAAAARDALNPAAAQAYSTAPYFWSDWYQHRIQFVGVPGAEEVRVVSGAADGDRFVALYRRGERLTGALTLNGHTVVMKYRNLIARRVSCADALEFAHTRAKAVAAA